MARLSKNVKIFIASAACIVLICAVVLTAYITSYRGRTVMKYNTSSVSEDMYAYWLAERKYHLLVDKTAVDTPEFWSSMHETGVTNDEYYTAQAERYIMYKLISAAIFDANYSLSAAARDEIQALLDESTELFGGKDKLEKAMKRYGADYDTVKSILIYNYKAQYLFNAKYGSDGTRATTDEAERFFFEHYRRVKIIALDKLTKGDIIEEMTIVHNSGGISEESFLSYMKNHSADKGYTELPDGYYMSTYSTYNENVKSAVAQMNVGETRIVEGRLDGKDYVFFVRRYENVKGDWGSAKYVESEWFENFAVYCANYSFNAWLSEQVPSVKVNRDNIDISMASVKTNNELRLEYLKFEE